MDSVSSNHLLTKAKPPSRPSPANERRQGPTCGGGVVCLLLCFHVLLPGHRSSLRNSGLALRGNRAVDEHCFSPRSACFLDQRRRTCPGPAPGTVVGGGVGRFSQQVSIKKICPPLNHVFTDNLMETIPKIRFLLPR